MRDGRVVTVACVGGRRAVVDVFVGDAVRRVSLWSEFLISYRAVGVLPAWMGGG